MVTLLGLALAVALQTSPTAAQTGRISGVVVEEGTNLPVRGARVSAVDPDVLIPPPGFEVFTDADGRYRLDHVAPGRHRLIAEVSGFARLHDPSASPIVDLAANQDLT